jgi:hypothetical protein
MLVSKFGFGLENLVCSHTSSLRVAGVTEKREMDEGARER